MYFEGERNIGTYKEPDMSRITQKYGVLVTYCQRFFCMFSITVQEQ